MTRTSWISLPHTITTTLSQQPVWRSARICLCRVYMCLQLVPKGLLHSDPPHRPPCSSEQQQRRVSKWTWDRGRCRRVTGSSSSTQRHHTNTGMRTIGVPPPSPPRDNRKLIDRGTRCLNTLTPWSMEGRERGRGNSATNTHKNSPVLTMARYYIVHVVSTSRQYAHRSRSNIYGMLVQYVSLSVYFFSVV